LNSIQIAAFMQKIDGPVVARAMSPSIVEWRTIGMFFCDDALEGNRPADLDGKIKAPPARRMLVGD